MSDNASIQDSSLRILYAAGPGNVIGTYEYWAKGQDDPSQVSVTYSSQFYDVCRKLGAKAYVISSFSDRSRWQDEQFILENRPNFLQNTSGILYHLGQVIYGLRLIFSAIGFRANVAVVDTGSTYWFMLSMLSVLGVRVIPSLHCTLWRKYESQRRVESKLLQLSRRFFAKDCAAILAVSQDIKGQVAQITQGNSRPVVEFLPAYRSTEFANVTEPNLERSPFRVLFAGRIESSKGVFDLLAIAQRFAVEGRQDIIFELCGDGSALNDLRVAVAQAGLRDTVICYGYCQKPEMRQRLGQSHVVIVPTRTEFVEGFNQVVAEGILAGRPVVTSSVCPALDYVQAAVVEVPPNDVKAYGDALLQLCDDRDFYEQKRRNCLNLQAQFYDPARSWSAALESILMERRSGNAPSLPQPASTKRFVIVQYAGDYRQTLQNFLAGKEETYYAQQYSVDSVADLAKQADEVAVICCLTPESYDEMLPNGVRAIGAGVQAGHRAIKPQAIISLIEKLNPTHLIVRMPMAEIFAWAIQNKVKTMALFASSIVSTHWKTRLKNYWLIRSLNHPQIEWVGSYGMASAQRLKHLGVLPRKIVPWDFLLELTPGALLPKSLRSQPNCWKLIYVGTLMAEKGVGDLLKAIAHLKAKKIPVALQIAGEDGTGEFARQANCLNIADAVEFLGVISTQRVEPLMREADLVVVPSRHVYPEGFPLTIHHALRSRTPIVASDHPMFTHNLQSGVNALLFPAGDAIALASSVAQLLADTALYEQISVASYETWRQLRLPVKWADMLERWMSETPENHQWLLSHSLDPGCTANLNGGTNLKSGCDRQPQIA
ncbi:MAG: glycosyltransferase family 4 protein [Drouetiella hepatica Uher 2000/2452]|jgi:glycosyltransferase involved in cell wall biosynthesis|uniref:Glycosyltransferase family 4 protein n=1 Tax=Drouetiella hepatica Uher 2000/2452 TaxID=904376 RepID=A0A951QA34_9CYAN|nr:glycosyltransferase family 4 protein [Drouetiella hepatica Uher 2000/2452]